MQFAVNYSRKLAALVKEEKVPLDRFKCPAWPDLVDEVLAVGQAYIHFPLVVGNPHRQIINHETQAPVDWDMIEALLVKTDTPYVNLHLTPRVQDYPHYTLTTNDPIHVEMITENCIQAVKLATSRLGADKIILENDHHSLGASLQVGYASHFLKTVLEATNTGFLLDISHARLAAEHLGLDAQTYLKQLPVDRIREIHLTGIQLVDSELEQKARDLGVDEAMLATIRGQRIDHLAMTEADYEFFTWCLDNIQNKTWATPWMIGYEYGGVGGFWELVADTATYLAQVPRLYGMVQSYQPVRAMKIG